MKPKVLILQKIIPSYRYPLFDDLNKKFDLTVGYQDQIHSNEVQFLTKKINSIALFNLYFPTLKFFKTISAFDVIIIMPDFHFLNFCILPFLLTQPKIISWSIGMRASYTLLYDTEREKTFLDSIMCKILNHCDANIFYYEHPLKFWGNKIDHKKVFIGFNTVKVKKIKNISQEKKDSILFLGSLIKGKGIMDLIKSFEKSSFKRKDSNLILNIIGDGPEYSLIDKYIKQNGLSKKIFLTGAIYDDEELESYFKKAICLISPGQAGLTVLKSFAFGVPFITSNNAITGGERLNIVNGFNGLFFKYQRELDDILERCLNDKAFFRKMGKNAYNFYWNQAKMDVMVDGFEKAIDYVLQKANI
jgi:glycosyltransferase involved in cell wall biosynthesis